MLSESDERTAPEAYGTVEVVCRGCLLANPVAVELLAGQERDSYPVKCSNCGERHLLVVAVETR